MAAVGQYTTREGFLERLLQTNETPNAGTYALIDSLVAQANAWIEGKTGRVLAPIPAFDSTFTGTAGHTYGTITDASGLMTGDSLLIGPLSGPHEAWGVQSISPDLSLGAATWAALTAYALDDVVQPVSPNSHTYRAIVAGTSAASQPTFPTNGDGVIDGTVVWLDLGLTNTTVFLSGALANTYAGAVCQRIFIADGHAATDQGASMVVDTGIITLAALEIAPYSGGQFIVAAPQDWYLRPTTAKLQVGWPFEEVQWTDVPTGTAYPTFYPGYANVRLIGPGPCVSPSMPSVPSFGFPAVVPEIEDIGYKVEMAAYRQRASSGGSTYTINPDGSRTFENALSYEDKMTIERYRQKSMDAV